MLEKKSIGVFLSQGAIAGAFGHFLFLCFLVIYTPNFYNFLMVFALPIMLAYGLAIGSVTASFVWLAGVLLKGRIGLLVAVFLALAAQGFMTAVSSLWREPPLEKPALILSLVWVCLTGLPVGVMTWSDARPDKMIIFGSRASMPSTSPALGRVVSFGAGLLLRLISLVFLLELLLLVAVWISYMRIEAWLFPSLETLLLFAAVTLYFAVSAYVSFWSPRKLVLLTLALCVNLPLLFWILNVYRHSIEIYNYPALLASVIVCIWVAYAFGRLITPRPAEDKLARGVYELAAIKIFPGL